ncbi:AT-rich interactive domain-containing protein 4A isoform X2 [Synchiropus splendidus]|uniref:AT-rich interactive domain-containing protein 4A isoform X2 n=1 Tax=Synchiropus splendidus TaxID=270530 RepID=UPI00237E164D|nr:AT-rich interactive domain-containing protein 4A isoform X2 [Synchiropus splendidus]
MKAADEPAYLTVGTDVSAKYRGAFCEAKIKTVKRMVKVKVLLKGESTSQVVQDDQVKGPLRVGCTVEVKTNEGLLSEAVISKLTDASLYTVVFDDGDEKTLRRTSLCLKGERHFAESETLDQLPLTNPEHFGTPVIGKKTNRGGRRSSQAVPDEENESSSSSDDEEDRRRLNDDLLGKVCSIKEGDDPSCWFLGLVVSPSCNDEQLVKKDQCMVRSFGDAKFFSVARSSMQHVNYLNVNKCSGSKGFEAARLFLAMRKIPEVWKMDMSQILDSSSSDEDDDDNDEEKGSDEEEEDEEVRKKKKLMKEEPEDEADPEERDHFLQQLYKFMEDRGTPINKPPVLGYKDLNLFKLFRLVYQHGGCDKIESGTVWKQIYMDLGIPILNSAASYNVKTAYKKYLYGFEEYCRSACITFRTIHHNNPRSPNRLIIQRPVDSKESTASLIKVERPAEKAESESESEKEFLKARFSSPRGRRRGAMMPLKLDREQMTRAEKRASDNSEEQREVRRRSNRRMDESEKGSDEEEEEDDEEEEEDDEDDEEEEDDDGEAERRVCSGDEEDSDSVTGTKVRVKYGRGKTQKIYEAHIKKTDMDNGEQFYLVHYYGWNVRYDEWVKADRIIWPAEKGSRKRRRKKVKNKDELEKESEKEAVVTKPVGAKRGRPLSRNIPNSSAGRSVSKTPSNDGRSNGRSSRNETTPTMANGDGTPRTRRTRRTSGLYDSDRASNEDTGNTSEDSEEDPPDKKPSPWRGRTEAPTSLEEKQEVKEEEQVVDDVKADAGDVTVAPPTLLVESAPLPSVPQETADEAPLKTEKKEAEQVVLPVETDMSPPRMDEKKSPAQERLPKMPLAEEEMVAEKEVHTTSPGQVSPPPPPKHTPASVPDVAEPESTALTSPRAKGRRSKGNETGAEAPPCAPLEGACASSPSPSTNTCPSPSKNSSSSPSKSSSPSHTVLSPAPRNILKRSEEPMVVLHCLSSQRLLPSPAAPANASDTDSATEEEGEEMPPEEKGGALLKRKAAEHKAADKKPRPEQPEELLSPVPPATDASLEDMKEEEMPRHLPAQAPSSAAAPGEEPQMDPEALVCHEVDLDDLDEKEKSVSSEHLLLMMGEQQQQQQPPPPPLPAAPAAHPEVRPLVPALPPCPVDLHHTRSSAEPEHDADGDSSPGFDGSTASSTSQHEQKDRGQKRVTDCHLSPTAKKHKRTQKRASIAGKVENNGAGHSSDSEDQSRSSSVKNQKSRCLTSPTSNKANFPSPQRTYKWTFQLDELDNMSSSERISFLQDKLQEIRKYYMSLKSEVASIDRRRKRLKKKEREVSHMTASTSSGSSDTAMSPSSASPSQNTVAVECR